MIFRNFKYDSTVGHLIAARTSSVLNRIERTLNTVKLKYYFLFALNFILSPF